MNLKRTNAWINHVLVVGGIIVLILLDSEWNIVRRYGIFQNNKIRELFLYGD